MPSLNRAGEECLSVILDYFYRPHVQRVRPAPSDVIFSFTYLELVSPTLKRMMIQDYSINPQTLPLLNDLRAHLRNQLQQLQLNHILPEPQPLVQPHVPDTAAFNPWSCSVGVYGQLFQGSAGLSLGPELKFNSLGNRSIKLNCSFSYDWANKSENSKVGGFFSFSKKELKGTVDVKGDLSQNSLESSITAQTNNPSLSNIGVRFKKKQSNRVQTVGIVVSHNFESDKVEVNSTVCVPTPLFDKSDLQGKNKKQVKRRVSSAKRRAEKQQTQCIQQPQPVTVYMHRGPTLASKAFLFGVLVYLFLDFVRRIIAFLKTKKLK